MVYYNRNSLVRANYSDLINGIHETTEYLELFLRNLLLNEKHPLHNRAWQGEIPVQAAAGLRQSPRHAAPTSN